MRAKNPCQWWWGSSPYNSLHLYNKNPSHCGGKNLRKKSLPITGEIAVLITAYTFIIPKLGRPSFSGSISVSMEVTVTTGQNILSSSASGTG